jgi:hypothetical protein
MTTVVEHPAQSLEMRSDMTFDEFAGHVWRKNRRDLRHKNGEPVELMPGNSYAFLMVGLKELLTPEQFALVLERFMVEVKKLEAEGLLPNDSLAVVATPFDVPSLPAIPDMFADELEDGVKIAIYLTGELSFTLAKKYPVAKDEHNTEGEATDEEIE